MAEEANQEQAAQEQVEGEEQKAAAEDGEENKEEEKQAAPVDPLCIQSVEEYDELLAQIEKPVIISFNAIWSPPCQRMNPIYDAHVPNYPEIIMKRCDVDDREDVQDKAGNNAMPTYMFFIKGAEIERLEGANEEGLKTLLEKAKTASGEMDKYE